MKYEWRNGAWRAPRKRKPVEWPYDGQRWFWDPRFRAWRTWDWSRTELRAARAELRKRRRFERAFAKAMAEEKAKQLQWKPSPELEAEIAESWRQHDRSVAQWRRSPWAWPVIRPPWVL